MPVLHMKIRTWISVTVLYIQMSLVCAHIGKAVESMSEVGTLIVWLLLPPMIVRFDVGGDLQLNLGFEPFEKGGGGEGNLQIFEVLSLVEVITLL
jgi:hypothetical protein